MHYINGLWSDEGGDSFTSLNPATQQILWQGKVAGARETEAAVAAARQAFTDWSFTDYHARLEILREFKRLIDASQEELTLLIAQETGKALWDAKSEAVAVSGKLAFTEEAYQERTGTKNRPMPAGNAVIRHRPHGVMAVYGPYNFPAHLPNGHIMPALLAGNTIVFKPSEQTPMVGEWMVRQWEKAGLPAGVVNLIQGERETGIALANSAIDGVLFTGSCATGKALHRQFAGRPEIMLALEMGGNNPLIVSNIEDSKAAVAETLLSAFTSSGQRCTCARRLILVGGDNSDDYLTLLVDSARKIQMGAYDSQPAPFMGPLISNQEADRLLAAQENLEKLGGKILVRMHKSAPHLPFVTPAIIDMTGVSDVPDTEYFGPLLQLYRVNSIEEAVGIANDTAFGLSASLLSDDINEYQYVSSRLRAGLINWNRQTTGASGTGPFGGVGISGNHRPAGYYSADYCAYPVASVELEQLQFPASLPQGLSVG